MKEPSDEELMLALMAGDRGTFAILMTPHVLIVCGALPGVFTTAILAGISLGRLLGGMGGLWLGSRAFRPAW